MIPTLMVIDYAGRVAESVAAMFKGLADREPGHALRHLLHGNILLLSVEGQAAAQAVGFDIAGQDVVDGDVVLGNRGLACGGDSGATCDATSHCSFGFCWPNQRSGCLDPPSNGEQNTSSKCSDLSASAIACA